MVTIKVDGIYCDSENRILGADEIVSCLRDSCSIETGVTLKDFMNLFVRYRVLGEFMAQYSSCYSLDEFIVEANTQKPEHPMEVDKLVIYWFVESNPASEGSGIVVDLSSGFLGYSDSSGQSYSMSLTPLNEFADLPIVMETKYTVSKLEDWREIAFQDERQFTLLEALDAVLYDISFYGGPQARSETRASIKEISETLQNICQANKNGDETTL